MSLILDIALPALVIFIMTVVGLELTYSDFTRMLHYPGLVVVVFIGQWILLPLVAALIIWALALPPVLASGMILVAAAPIAALSNFYSMLAGANVALAVSLTAVSSVLAVVTTPLIASLAFGLFLNGSAGFDLPVARALLQTVIGLFFPIMAGMSIRRLSPAWVSRRRLLLQRVSLLAVAALVSFVIIDQYVMISAQIMLLLITSLLFTLGLLVVGWLVGRIAGNNRKDRLAVLFSFPARNLAFATLIAVGAVGRIDIASFAAVFFVVQAVLLVSLALFLHGQSRFAGG